MSNPSTDPARSQLRQVRLGRTGLHVSSLGLGMMSYGEDPRRAWKVEETHAEPIIRRAIELGVTFFDTADMYAAGSSEIVTGRLLAKLIPREEAVVATKVYYATTPGPNGKGLSRKHLFQAIDASLERLQMDYVDLYQIHRWDTETPIEETMEALHDIVKSGKARYLGASTMSAWQFAKAQRIAELNGWTAFVSMQNLYNLLYREEEREMIPQCVDQGVAILPYSPLARGLLAGTRSPNGERRTTRAAHDPTRDAMFGTPDDFDIIDRVTTLADQRGVKPAQIALAWLLQKPEVTAPIIGATKPSHIDDAVAAATLALSAQEIDFLEATYRPHNVID